MNDDGLRGSTGIARHGRGARNVIDQSMRGYLQQLEQQGEMVRVTKEIDPAANMSAPSATS